jgi:hypothetical protein
MFKWPFMVEIRNDSESVMLVTIVESDSNRMEVDKLLVPDNQL